VTDPDCDDVQPGEILVAPVTDPAWAAIMFISAGLVVDIGGQLSHAAVVARELGIPCVMGIPDATKRLRTGDVCRIDGHAGTVEILRRATPVGASEPRK
jgi:pyruvate,water dikinase